MINIPAFTAVTTAAVQVAVVPPGPCTVIVSNTGSATAYIGTSNAVTASGGGSGFPLPAGATVTIPGYPGSAGSSLWAISGTSATVGVIISTSR